MKGYMVPAKHNNRFHTELASWIKAREWHAGYTGHRRSRLLACGDHHGCVHPQFFLQSFIGRQDIVPFSHHEQELLGVMVRITKTRIIR